MTALYKVRGDRATVNLLVINDGLFCVPAGDFDPVRYPRATTEHVFLAGLFIREDEGFREIFSCRVATVPAEGVGAFALAGFGSGLSFGFDRVRHFRNLLLI